MKTYTYTMKGITHTSLSLNTFVSPYTIGTPTIKAPKNQLAPNWDVKKKLRMKSRGVIHEKFKYSLCSQSNITGERVIIQKQYSFRSLTS